MTIPSSVRSLGDYAFYQCSLLSKISISEGLMVGDNAFSCCPNLGKKTVTDLKKRYPNFSISKEISILIIYIYIYTNIYDCFLIKKNLSTYVSKKNENKIKEKQFHMSFDDFNFNYINQVLAFCF